jgi:hypothetical protein
MQCAQARAELVGDLPQCEQQVAARPGTVFRVLPDPTTTIIDFECARKLTNTIYANHHTLCSLAIWEHLLLTKGDSFCGKITKCCQQVYLH